KKKSSNEVVEDLFKRAKEHGAVPLDRSGKGPEPSRAKVELWKSGFSLDDGELRNYSDPGNANFLDAIRRGEIPLELRQRTRGGQVNLDMEDHRDEDYVKPKMAFKAFEGEGQKLGRCSFAANEAQASASVNLDPSEPTTNIQIRLADGGKLVQKFNHTHSCKNVCRTMQQVFSELLLSILSREIMLIQQSTFGNNSLQTILQRHLFGCY
uniref:NSFL1 (p97) cofactor (p47) n=1 Tax=Oryzias melastigma TaxID=30732 RepID=A0A3B3E0V0_ORYME